MSRLREARGRAKEFIRDRGRRSRAWTARKARENPKKTRFAILMLVAFAAFQVWFRTPPGDLEPALAMPTVVDITQLYPVEVSGVVRPRSIAEVQRALATTDGPFSIGGGRYSMGGQTAAEDVTQLDMRGMNRVLAIDAEAKTVRVQAGITWRALQRVLDARGFSVRIMQTYSSFTVGGSLGVNVHGRYVGEGPLVRSVVSLRMVLADGSLVDASPTVNSELFYGAIGGYGSLGVIVEATLGVAENVRVERVARAMPVARYPSYFARRVRGDTKAVFHNGDLHPPDYDVVQAITWRQTTRPLTERRHLQPRRTSSFSERVLLWLDTQSQTAKRFRERIYEPYVLRDRPVVYRNFEASYDAHELDPFSRDDTTYVLQEYFVPIRSFSRFVPRMREILQRHEVNALNLSIRHAHPDPGTTMAWAREEVFAFVLYYAQGTSDADRREVARWTRELIDEVTAVGGAYYLPYQPHASLAQMRRAYPNFDRLLALKRRYDPDHRFRNRLLDRYDPPWNDPRYRARRTLHADADRLRNEEQTFLTVPEWYIVFAANEYATHLAHERPSAMPYFGQIAQYWQTYRRVYHRTKDTYPWNAEYHTMIGVIGVSFSLENVVKGVYENTIGRLAELFARTRGGAVDTEEDRFAARVAAEYDTFIRLRPWYEFSFARRLSQLWKLDSSRGSSRIRTGERLIALSLEYGIKSLYAGAIEWASHSAYGTEETTTSVWMQRPASVALPPGTRSIARFADDEEVAELPRYEPFGAAATALARGGARFREIAGNGRIALTVVAPAGHYRRTASREVLARWPVLTMPGRERVLIVVPVSSLHEVLAAIAADPERLVLDHVFDD
jgi:FAD/FMN-containing dehydrogenase